MKNKIKITENDVKKACDDYLQVLENQGKLMFIRNNTLAVQTKSGHYVKNGKVGSPDILVWMTGAKKVPISVIYPKADYIMVRCLKTIAIECKSDIGKQSADQIKWQADFERLGGAYYVVRSLDEVIKIIEGR